MNFSGNSFSLRHFGCHGSAARRTFCPLLSERLLIDEPIAAGSILCLDGQLRSYNKVVEGSGRLLITAFAQRLLPEEDEENPNRVQLTGALCKAPSYRTTPFGREIADLMLAVNRSYGKSDYIPCITWGRTARYAANLKIGDKVQLVGRFQSRNYQKQLPDGTILNKVAYEVSVSRLSAMKEDPLTEALQSMNQRMPLQGQNTLSHAREY